MEKYALIGIGPSSVFQDFETSVKNLYCIGNGGKMTRGVIITSCSGEYKWQE